MVRVLDRLHATDDDLVFFDFLSAFQIDKLHPDYVHGQLLPDGHPALRTPQQKAWFDAAMEAMDKIYASGISDVIVLPEVYDLSRIAQKYTKNDRPYLKRGWCHVELSVATYFGRVANPEDAPQLPQRTIDPAEVKRLLDSGEIRFTSPSDEGPVLDMYRRYFYAGQKNRLLDELRAGRAEAVHEGICSALRALSWQVRHKMVQAVGQAGATVLTEEVAKSAVDDDRDVRGAAVGSLQQLIAVDGQVRGRACAVLQRHLEDQSWVARMSAAEALPQLAAGDPDLCGRALTAMLPRLRDEDGHVRAAAVRALPELTAADPALRGQAFTAVLPALQDDEWLWHFVLA